MAKTWQDIMDKLYLNEHMSDITIYVGQSIEDAHRFPAHKFVLTISSLVWEKLLTCQMEESSTKIILIKDVEPNIFEHVLKYLYKHTLKLSSIEECLEVLHAAEKYFLHELKEVCSQEFFTHQITVDNFWTLYYNFYYYPELIPPKLILQIMKYLHDNASMLFLREKFKLLPHPALLKIIQHSELKITETLLFECVMEWAKLECLKQKLEYIPHNLRVVLGDVLYHLRFLTMTIDQLQFGPIASEILNKQEVSLFIKSVNEKVGCLQPPWDNNRLKLARSQTQTWSKSYPNAVDSPNPTEKDNDSMVLVFTKDTIFQSITAVNKTAGYIEAVLKDLKGVILQKWSFYSEANKSNSFAGCLYLKAYTCYEFEIKGANIQCYKADPWGSFYNEVVYFCCRKSEIKNIDNYKNLEFVTNLFDTFGNADAQTEIPFLYNSVMASFC